MFKQWFWFGNIILVLAIGFLTLRPSFNLALTGDDYFAIWRYYYYIDGQGGPKISNLSYFFTDYGPVDMFTAAIYNYFGFKDQVYYVFSLAFRVLAAVSFLWPVYRLTKSKWASLGSMAFFLITVTGLEATDWSFNMPSYLAIAIMNILLAIFSISRTKNNLLIWATSSLLFTAAVISQPIRMMFLPVLMVLLESFWLITNISWKNVILGILKITMYVFLIATILKYSHYGESASARGKDAILANYGQVITQIKQKNYKLLLTPINQIGVVILPNIAMYQRLEDWGLARTFRRVVIPAVAGYLIWLILLKFSKKTFALGFILGLYWTNYIWQKFVTMTANPIQPFELLTYLLGGLLLISTGLWWISLRKQKNLQLSLTLAILIMFGGFMVAWLRNPGSVIEITGRYLIVPAAGLAWLMAFLLATAIKTKNIVLIVIFGLLFSLHAKTSYEYLYHLSSVRGIELTNRLRNSVQVPPYLSKSNAPVVYYFEGDNPDILHHAFIFGWPVIAVFRFNFSGPWYHIAPTNSWEEVVSAYLDGKSLKRFMPGPWKPVSLENIFAYRLENRQLIDETEEKREILKNLKTKLQPPF